MTLGLRIWLTCRGVFTRFFLLTSLALSVFWFPGGSLAGDKTSPANLLAQRPRCEYRANPLGIDVTEPQLSWIVASSQRGQRQTAYRMLVASSIEKLHADQGDLWDTGRVESDQTLHLPYAGEPLRSGQSCFWKVRVWDNRGRSSAWSRPATWSMGLLHPSDWQAQWIAADAKPLLTKPRTPHNGYHSQFASNADEQKWVTIDLGTTQNVDTVRLHPARPFDYKDTPGFLFPVRFKIEVSTKADFSDAKVVVDHTKADFPNPGARAASIPIPPTKARYVRLTATRLGQRDPGIFAMALAEFEILSAGKKIAIGSDVTCLDAIEAGGWSLARLVDGRTKADQGDSGVIPQPATILRKDFALSAPVKKAMVYVTGLGLYELWLNGQRVGRRQLAPEWTRYPDRLQYQTYDVTNLLQSRENAIGAILSEGWYAGRLMSRPAMRKPVFRLLLRLEIELADGSRTSIITDSSWRGTTNGPIRKAGIYDGELYDARKEMLGWNMPGFDAAAWKPVRTVEAYSGKLVAQPNEPIRVTREISPVKRTQPQPNTLIYDFGQNLVGWCRIKLRGSRGTQVTLRHAEWLEDDGTLHTQNLGAAAQTDRYILRGEREEIYEPRFTYHGFRYLEVTGLSEPLPTGAVVARVIRSSAPIVGQFECSNPLLNQLMKNIRWVQRGNMQSVPTDCPQRAERLGWMGDIQCFCQTAVYNMDMAAFFTKWVTDIRDSQADDGRFSDYSPNMLDPNRFSSGVPGWGDAGTVVPWRVYQNYADRRILERHFDSARRWVDFIHHHNPNLLWQNNRGNDFNDWLNSDTVIIEGFPRKGGAIPKEVFATAFFAHSTELVAKMAQAIGRDEEASRYLQLANAIKKAFRDAYVEPDGTIRGDTQAGYALALRFNLVEPSERPAVVKHLLAAIERFKGHPSTGIQTTHRMMLELSRGGEHEEAYRMVNLRTPPSWGHAIEMGATTIWERWDAYAKGRGMHPSGMNSMNHWALGSVGEWIWRDLVGINPDDERPGYKHFFIRPRPTGDLTWTSGRYDSIRGPIESRWKIEDGRFHLHVVLPANTTATVVVPTRDPENVTESDRPAADSPGVAPVKQSEPDAATFRVQSGVYEFSASW